MDQPDLLVTLESRDLFFEICRFPCIVCIEEGDQLTCRFANAAIACCRHTRVVLTDIPHLVGKRCDYSRSLVSRTIVYNDDLRWRTRLIKDAAYRIHDEPSIVVSRNYD